ncbi:MAG: DUF4625 domain-containing protein [Bacteroidales bacterium]|nr:DUF4625 domain-containing protein [Bacteroidales bacterium]
MKDIIKLITTAALAVIIASQISSCKKDDGNSEPVISNFELGYENSKIAYIGTDLHIEADIEAEAQISTIEVKITAGNVSKGSVDEYWSIDSVYTKFDGLKNSNFHEHLDIPMNTIIGSYQFTFIVTDKDGQTGSKRYTLSIEEPNDTEAPFITINSAPSNVVYQTGDKIKIEGTIDDNIALAGLKIALVRVNQNLSDDAVTNSNTITLLHLHEFDMPTHHIFTTEIEVGALNDHDVPAQNIEGSIAWESGEYYVLVKGKDAFGGNWAYSSHYPLTINLN